MGETRDGLGQGLTCSWLGNGVEFRRQEEQLPRRVIEEREREAERGGERPSEVAKERARETAEQHKEGETWNDTPEYGDGEKERMGSNGERERERKRWRE